MSLKTARNILDFWFDESVEPMWFKKDAAFDRQVEENFLDTYELAARGGLANWKDRPKETLALIILLDQFPRNMFRNSSRAFATDKLAVELTKYAISRNFDADLSIKERIFLYMPLMHSERLEDQEKAIEVYTQLGKEDNLEYALKHKEIIDRFGRFPHRNKILGRESTAAEKLFLSQPGSSF